MPDEGGGSRRWDEVESLVRRLEPEIIQVFERHGVPPERAGEVLEEVVTVLLYRWGEVARPETWLLEMLEMRAAAAAGVQLTPSDGD
jgi:hypothetical protein